MRTHASVRPLVAGLLVALMIGCASGRPKRAAVGGEPPLLTDADPVVGGTEIVQAPEARPVTVADRHPILSRPKEYYDTTNGNKLTRTAAATFIGVPSGIGAEVKQIFVGQPQMK